MNKNYFLTVFAIAVIYTACSPAKESTDVWVNKEKLQGKSYSKIFIVVMTADIEARAVVESDLAAAATAKGYTAVKSVDVMPPLLSDPKTPTKDEIVSKVKASGCDAAFVASLLKKDENIQYTKGSTAYAPGTHYSWNTYYGYYSNLYPTVSTPAYYSNDKTYFMQSNLYDVASEEIMWSVRSNVFNPSSLKSFSKAYTASLVSQLEKAKLLKK